MTGTAYFDDFSVEKMVVDGGTAIDPENGENTQVVQTFSLNQNYPNPFNPTTTITYNLPEKTQVSLTIYNILGQQVRTLTNTVQNAGTYSVAWDAKNKMGEQVTSGIYLYVLTSNDQRIAKKMVLMR